HVRFTLEFPTDTRRPLRFSADGLKPLDGQGPYGTTLTVLDMVNKKVLSQSVLFPSTPLAEVSSQLEPGAPAPVQLPVRMAEEHLAPISTTAKPSPPQMKKSD